MARTGESVTEASVVGVGNFSGFFPLFGKNRVLTLTLDRRSVPRR